MPNLHIPRIGEVITLDQPWTFTLWEEYRNLGLIKLADPTYTGNGYGSYGRIQNKSWKYTFSEGVELTVNRIYIRQNQPNFDSVTFSTLSLQKTPKGLKERRVRFWAKLDDVNTMIIK